MLITIRVPDNTVKINYECAGESGKMTLTNTITLDKIIKIEHEGEHKREE